MGGCCFSTPRENVQPLQQPEPEIQHGERKNDELKNDELKNEGFNDWPFTEFFFSDLKKATKNFSSDELISSENGEESSNIVYKGLLKDNLGFVAVKRFKNTPWDDPEYFAEDAKAVGELKHKRLVTLLGYCCDCDENAGLLVAEFMPNDTLAKRLFNQRSQTMKWSMRLRVAYHIAEALEYCDNACFDSYCNLSAYTVLFDKDDEARLSSFGLVKEIIDFDRRRRRNVNTESVTYRFGTILVNLLTGLQFPPSHAPEMINGKDVTELIDPNLKGEFSKEEATVVLKLASECFQCEYRKSLMTKELVATLEALQDKNEIPSLEMLELAKQHDVASTSQQQQVETPHKKLHSYKTDIFACPTRKHHRRVNRNYFHTESANSFNEAILLEPERSSNMVRVEETCFCRNCLG